MLTVIDDIVVHELHQRTLMIWCRTAHPLNYIGVRKGRVHICSNLIENTDCHQKGATNYSPVLDYSRFLWTNRSIIWDSKFKLKHNRGTTLGAGRSMRCTKQTNRSSNNKDFWRNSLIMLSSAFLVKQPLQNSSLSHSRRVEGYFRYLVHKGQVLNRKATQLKSGGFSMNFPYIGFRRNEIIPLKASAALQGELRLSTDYPNVHIITR